jgi:hypothetical protein
MDVSSVFPGMPYTAEKEMVLAEGVTSALPECNSGLDSTVMQCAVEEEATPEDGKGNWLGDSGPG